MMVSSSLGRQKKNLQGRIASAKPLKETEKTMSDYRGAGGIEFKYSNQIN